MEQNSDNFKSRRAFLKSGLRTSFLGGIVFISGLLGWRKIYTGSQENSCTYFIPCRSCRKLSKCDDSKAVDFKQQQNSNQQD